MFGPYAAKPSSSFEEGAEIEAVDQALSGFGHGHGALATGDLAASMSAGASAKNIATWKYPAFVNRLPKHGLCELAGTARKPAQAGTSTTISAVRRRTPS